NARNQRVGQNPKVRAHATQNRAEHHAIEQSKRMVGDNDRRAILWYVCDFFRQALIANVQAFEERIENISMGAEHPAINLLDIADEPLFKNRGDRAERGAVNKVAYVFEALARNFQVSGDGRWAAGHTTSSLRLESDCEFPMLPLQIFVE